MTGHTLLWFGAMHGLWFLFHYYVGRTLIEATTFGRRARQVFWVLVASLALLGLLALWGGRLLGTSLGYGWLSQLGFGYMGFFALIVFASIARDALRWAILLLARLRLLLARLRARSEPSASPRDAERRRFFANATSAGLLAGTTLLTGWGYRRALTFPEVVSVDVPLARLPKALEGYRIVQLSDIHIGPMIRGAFLEAVVDRVNALGADLVAVTGDVVDGTVAELGPEVAALGRLRGRDGVYFVTGNHEYYWDAEAWVDEMRRLGLIPLENTHRVIERAGARLLVAGCRDHRAHSILAHHRSDPEGARRGAPPCDLSVLLAHQPQSVRGALAGGYDLMLSGHTHGGQFFPITLLAGLAHPFVAGLHRVRALQVYVNRGTGYWGPPLRIGTRSEITVLTLRGAAADEREQRARG